MGVEVEYDGIEDSRRNAHRNIRDATQDGATAARDSAQSRVRVGIYGGPHLKDSIRLEERSPREIGKGVIEAVVQAGIEGSLVAWANEAGTGDGWNPPADTEDPFPPSTAPEQWVYYNEKAGAFFTTSGMTPQPYMGPGFEDGREVAERGYRGIHA
jgi:hypothetical protein